MGADGISLAAAAAVFQTAEAATFADSADENERQLVSRKEDSCAIIWVIILKKKKYAEGWIQREQTIKEKKIGRQIDTNHTTTTIDFPATR